MQKQIVRKSEIQENLDFCRTHYKYFAEYKTRWVFFMSKDDYMMYIILHKKKSLISYGRLQ